MSSLNIPQQSTAASSGTLHNPHIQHDDDLAPTSHSRRSSAAGPNLSQSASPGAPTSASARAGLVPLPAGSMQSTAENYALISPVDWKEADHLATTDPTVPTTTFYVGKDRKPFHLPTAALKEQSPYLRKLLSQDPNAVQTAGSLATGEQTVFDEFDEFGTRLFMHWINSHGNLHGPHDFHSLAHYLSLYVMARKFEIEPLENQVMDLVRRYYHTQNMTAPAYRLEYIYTYTHSPNKMRSFLLSTAAFRALEDSHAGDHLHRAGSTLQKTYNNPSNGGFVSDSVKAALARNPEMAIDFVEAVVRLHRCGEHDARKGIDCDWHVHEQTAKCPPQTLEPWQSDGAADEKKTADTKPAAPAWPSAPPATPTKPADPAKSAEEAKNDDGPFKRLGAKMKDKMHAKKDKSPEKDQAKADKAEDKAAEKAAKDKAKDDKDKAKADEKADKAKAKEEKKKADDKKDDAITPTKK